MQKCAKHLQLAVNAVQQNWHIIYAKHAALIAAAKLKAVLRIAVDLMGGDRPPIELLKGALEALKELAPSFSLVGLATPQIIKAALDDSNAASLERVEFFPTAAPVEMTDEPIGAWKKKRTSSLLTGMRMVKRRQADALVTAGNTGALIASATLGLAKLPGMKRPGLLAFIPTTHKFTALIDVGGNVLCKARHLVQYAYLGALYMQGLTGNTLPRVGLLNIGVESKKGHAELQKAYQMLQGSNQSSFAFCGNVEPGAVFQGNLDVVVTDGFSGNIFLKTAEGTADFIFHVLEREVTNPALSDLKRSFHYAEYPGAVVCGVDGVVVKCHGQSGSLAFKNGVLGAAGLLKRAILPKVRSLLESLQTDQL